MNIVVLYGHLGHSPELRYTSTGQAVASFSLATNDYYKDANGETVTRTDWHKCVCFGKTAELAQQLLTKGSPVVVAGCLRCEEYTAKDGTKRKNIFVKVESLQFLGQRTTKPEAQSSGQQEDEPLPF